MTSPGEITQLLQRADQGDDLAVNELFRLVQADLKTIVRNIRRRFDQRIDAPTTMLVDDAFLRLVGQQVTEWQPGDRGRFFSYMATKVHNMLVDQVRKSRAKKAGGQWKQVPLTDIEVGEEVSTNSHEHESLLIDLEDALTCFGEFAEEDANTFRIRYFLNCSYRETAEILDVSESECKRRFARAKMWLRRELEKHGYES